MFRFSYDELSELNGVKLREKYFSVKRSVMAMFSQANTFNIRMRLTVEVQGEIVEHSPARLLKRSNVEEKSFKAVCAQF